MFLKVDKELFKMGLDATEILILAQIMEFETNTGDCFISNETLAQNLGVSVDTIKRRLTKLEKEGLIKRDTKASQKGKERHIKTTFAKSKMHHAESANCTLRKEQNAPIKDNIEKKKEKDNSLDNKSSLRSDLLSNNTQPEVKVVKIYPPTREFNAGEAYQACVGADGNFFF